MGSWGRKYRSQTVCRAALGALLLVAVLCPSANGQVADSGPPLEGAAYTATESAYKAFSQGDYKASAASAAEAVARRPDLLRLHLLLIDSLVAAGDLALIYVPSLQPLFETEALTPEQLAIVLALAPIPFIAVEIEKWVVRRRDRTGSDGPP